MRHGSKLVAAYAILLALLITLSSGCMLSKGFTGVDNNWRKDTNTFKRGETTEKEVLEALGPPSQIIALNDRTIFYYLLEEKKQQKLILLVFNQSDTNVIYDRAIFFFNKEGVLTEYSFSKETIQRGKPKK